MGYAVCILGGYWVLLSELRNHLMQRVVFFFFSVSQLLPFLPVVGTFLAGKDRAE